MPFLNKEKMEFLITPQPPTKIKDIKGERVEQRRGIQAIY